MAKKRFSIWRMQFLHPAMWHDHDIDFARWLHRWQWIHQVAAPCNVWLWDDMPLNSNKRPPYWNSTCTSGFDFDHITAVDMSFYTSDHSEILIKSDHYRQKKMTSYRFSRWRISAILDFRNLIMGSLESPCGTSYRSSIDTVALNCLVFEKFAFCILASRSKMADLRHLGF